MPSEPHGPADDWDRIDVWTRRVGRWLLAGVPTWFILLAVFNQDNTGIPWAIGFVLASVLALVVTAIVDRRFMRARRLRMGRGGRVVAVWLAVYAVLALVIGTTVHTSAIAVLVVPFVAATAVAGFVELGRRAMGRH